MYKYIFIILTFISCTKEVNIKLPVHKTKLVLNCFFEPDSIFKVKMSNSVSSLDNLPNEVADALVILHENNVLFDTLFYENVFYYSTKKAQTGKTYHITAIYQNKSISSENIVPAKPILISSSYKKGVFIDEEGYPVSQAQIQIKDKQLQQKFYELFFKEKYISYNGEIILRNSFFTQNTDPVLQNEGLLDYYPTTLVFSDELFQGQEYTLNVNYINPKVDNDYELFVYLRSVSEDYYLYKQKLVKHLFNQDDDIWDGVGEPIQMYTNIIGGYGVFAGYNEIIDTAILIN